MQSTLRTTLLMSAAVLLSALAGTQAAQAGGYYHSHFESYVMDGLNDDDDTDRSGYGYDTEDAVSTAVGVAQDVLGIDDDGDDD